MAAARVAFLALLVRKDWNFKETLDDYQQDGSLVSRLLRARGFVDPERTTAFLHPSPDGFHDPFLLLGMDAATSAILEHIRLGSRIMVHGDYDVDGITATATVTSFLRQIGADCRFYIPDRLTEGYGLSESGIEAAAADACALLITVDCGISGFEEIHALRKRGIETVVTDHHECKDRIPEDARAVVNPRQPGETYPFACLSGAGVALKLIHALCIRLGRGEKWRDYLDFAALGTMADVMPLTGENRVMVQLGIQSIQRQDNLGIATMLRYINMCGKPVTSAMVGFTLAPRLNAAGRMGDAARAVDLLLTQDPAAADTLAKALCEDNQKRKDVENTIIQDATRMIDESFDFAGRGVIIVHKEGWHQGIIGIVASRLAETFCRPAIVLAGEDGVYRGSSRSFGDFDMLGAITYASEHVLKYGGHRKACGMMISAGGLDAFVSRINEYARLHLDLERCRHTISIDMPLDMSSMTERNARDLAILSPFGEGNREPVFVTSGLLVREMWMLGNGHHLKLSLADPATGRSVSAIGFGMELFDGLVGIGDRIDIAYSLDINSWNGQESLQLKIRDIRPSDGSQGGDHDPRLVEADQAFRQRAESATRIAERLGLEVSSLIPSKPEFTSVYQYIKANFSKEPLLCDLTLLARKISRSYQQNLDWFRLSRILDVFGEAALIRQQILGADRRHITVLPVEGKASLHACASFRYLLDARQKGDEHGR
jgi:single-stranded-DNA-specific exonuclease